MDSLWFLTDRSIVPSIPLGSWPKYPLSLYIRWFLSLKDQWLCHDPLLFLIIFLWITIWFLHPEEDQDNLKSSWMIFYHGSLSQPDHPLSCTWTEGRVHSPLIWLEYWVSLPISIIMIQILKEWIIYEIMSECFSLRAVSKRSLMQ